MSKYIYNGTAYRQSLDPTAPWIISFVAAAEEILEWAGIPRRAEDREIGFQRTDDPKRVDKAKRFFQFSGNNQSPTALVLGIHPVADDGERIAHLEFLDGDENSVRRTCRLVVKNPNNETIEQVTERIKQQILLRLDQDTSEVSDDDSTLDDAASGDEENDGETSENESNQEQEEEEENVQTADREVELGRSILDAFLDHLENPKWCRDNESHLREIAKPATIIDGQHRVLGAAKCERDIPFTICALYDCPWSEQVFQFTVVNYTAEGIPDQFITANASLSLTGGELKQLTDRLVQAEVKVVEYVLMSVVNFSDESPFQNLVNLTEKNDATKIGYKTMVRVAKVWYEGKNRGVQKLLKKLYPDIIGRNANSQRITRWKESGDWGRFFIVFWRQLRDAYNSETDYEGRSLWSVGANLLIAIVLLDFQNRFLINLASQSDSFFNIVEDASPREQLLSKLIQRTDEFLSYFPADFFALEWKTKSLNTGAGRDVLQFALSQMVDSGGTFRYANSKLVKGIKS